jgi:hypothetical protein
MTETLEPLAIPLSADDETAERSADALALDKKLARECANMRRRLKEALALIEKQAALIESLRGQR